jgi:hypothetical protein
MLSDAVTSKKQAGEVGEHVEVLDVSQILLRAMAPVGASVGAPGTEHGAEVGTEGDDVAGLDSAATEHGAQS